MISADELSKRVSYDPETGLFLWIENISSKARAGHPAFATRKANGYLFGRTLGYSILSHRAAWLLTYGTWPKGEIDHINGDKTDNRIDNLRDCSRSENQHNRPRYSNNKSGLKGVSWHKQKMKWRAVIALHGKSKHLGLFDDKLDAFEAYKSACSELHRDFSNFGGTE